MKLLVILAILCAVPSRTQEWHATPKADPLTGTSYTLYELTGKFLTPPSRGDGQPPVIMLRCDPSSNHGRISGKLLDAFIFVNTVIDLENGGTTVHYRLDDGKLQDSNLASYSTDYQAIHLQNVFVNNLLWGHLVFHKPGKGDQVHKVVIAVQEHLAGRVVMQFDMPDAEQVGAACGTEYK